MKLLMPKELVQEGVVPPEVDIDSTSDDVIEVAKNLATALRGIAKLPPLDVVPEAPTRVEEQSVKFVAI